MPSCTQDDIELFFDNWAKYDKIFYKWLAPNDYIWSEKEELHQSGLLIPWEHIDFFGIEELPSRNLTRELEIYWFYEGELYTRRDVKYTRTEFATLKYYVGGNRAGRPESHLTNVYIPYFKKLEAPLFLLGRKEDNRKKTKFNAIIIDDDELLEDVKKNLGMPEGSLWGVMDVEECQISFDFNFKEELENIIFKKANAIYKKYNKIPSTEVTSDTVWDIFKEYEYLLKDEFTIRGLSRSKNPLNILLKRHPGDLTRWALTKVELMLVKFLEKLHYPKEIISRFKNKGFEEPL